MKWFRKDKTPPPPPRFTVKHDYAEGTGTNFFNREVDATIIKSTLYDGDTPVYTKQTGWATLEAAVREAKEQEKALLQMVETLDL